MNFAWIFKLVFLVTSVLFLAACDHSDENRVATAENAEMLLLKAQELAQKFIIVDGHIDVPYRLTERMEDISVRTKGGDFDYVRAKAGGLNAPFMSIYIPARYQVSGGARELADELIDMVYRFSTDWPDKFAVATSAAEVRGHFEAGLISLPMGMENGAAIEGKLENLQYFYNRGIRYITLTHSKNNDICDSSYDEERRWNGLSPFGEQLVREMNRLGIMIDASHISDSTFYDVIQISKAPLIASHSSCRYYTPNWERNMSDEMIQLLAEKGGVICVNFGSSFLKSEYLPFYDKAKEAIDHYLQENRIAEGTAAAQDYYQQYRKEHPVGTIEDLMMHFDHVVELVGVDHVGFGSDFDGVLSLPRQIQDVSDYPNIIHELLKRGYSEEDIEKICGGNLLRVWSQVEQLAKQLQQAE